jgi:CBS-domain-containing membrane protein
MQAREFMTKDPVTVSADTPTPEIARLLLAHGISAAPVVDDAGTPIGMVSEGDLLGRGEVDRQARRDWWLMLLAEGEALRRLRLRQPSGASTLQDTVDASSRPAAA